MSVKPSKEKCIELCLINLAAGIDRGNSMTNISKQVGVSARTFDRYWAMAKKLHAARQEEATKKANEAFVQNKVDATKEAVMTAQERLEILSKIAKGELETQVKKPAWNHAEKKFQIVTVLQSADVPNRIKAIAELNRMEGAYAPIPSKVEHSGRVSVGLLTPEVIFVETPQKISDDIEIKESEE